MPNYHQPRLSSLGRLFMKDPTENIDFKKLENSISTKVKNKKGSFHKVP